MTLFHAAPSTGAPRTPRPAVAPLGRYDFLFRELRDEPWRPLGDTEAARRANLGELAETMFAEPTVEGSLPAAWTFFGQFVAHDLSFDARSDLTDTGRAIQSHRSPRFDLDSVYGEGPRCQPHLYQARDPRKLAIGRNEAGEPDLPRSDDASLDHPATTQLNRRRTALIGDPRNDENVVVAQLHLAFLKFHNRLVDEGSDFEEARRLTRLHYQWVLLHEYLATLCGRPLVNRSTARGRGLFPSSAPAFVPYEFAFAAFRFGHSMVGASYHLSDALEHERGGHPLVLYTFDSTDWRSRDRSAAQTLDGQRALPRRWTVQWDRFLPGEGRSDQRAQRIDARLAEPLQYLPLVVTEPAHRKLAFRTLLRGWHLGLPSGQSVARHLGERPLDPQHPNGDPLWLYVLREAEAGSTRGDRLGPVGARLVGEVCLRLLQCDPDSLLHQPDWVPTLAHRDGFGLEDFLAYAGVPITQADWLRVAGDGPDA